MIGSSLNPNHPLPIIRVEPFHGRGKTDLRLDSGASRKIRAAMQHFLNFKIVRLLADQFR
jgi:hypothetical protein